MAAHHKLAVCPNCDTPLGPTANFCPNCGQENHEVKLPLQHIGYEFIESITHFDNKLWNSLKAIFTRPGQMTAEFLEGKRARFVPPARLYVFVSVIFFFLVGKYASHRIIEVDPGERQHALRDDVERSSLGGSDDDRKDSLLLRNQLNEVAAIEVDIINHPAERRLFYQELAALPDRGIDSLLQTKQLATTTDNRARLRQLITTIRNQPIDYNVFVAQSDRKNGSMIPFPNERSRQHFLDEVHRMSNDQLDSTLQAHKLTANYINRLALRKAERITEFQQATNTNAIADEFGHLFIKSLSGVMFVLMPFVAFLLWLFYVRRKQYRRYYYEHLIFSIHAHTVLFLLLSVALLVAVYLGHYLPEGMGDRLLKITVGIGAIYFLLSLKRVYRQSWPRTLGKFALIFIIYGLTITLFMALAIGLSINSL